MADHSPHAAVPYHELQRGGVGRKKQTRMGHGRTNIIGTCTLGITWKSMIGTWLCKHSWCYVEREKNARMCVTFLLRYPGGYAKHTHREVCKTGVGTNEANARTSTFRALCFWVVLGHDICRSSSLLAGVLPTVRCLASTTDEIRGHPENFQHYVRRPSATGFSFPQGSWPTNELFLQHQVRDDD